ncbi:MAG TPA: transposase [Candidatus Marinimicrobia bacterium]|nr:transposase [Candidatus Neomarinimicrobiota bacterium]
MRQYNREKHHRHSIRLPGYDYSQPGAYFVTICTQNRECLFGEIVNGEMILNEYGNRVERCWVEIPHHFSHVALDEFVAMPNHVHGVIVIVENVGARHVGARYVGARYVGARHAVPPHNSNQCIEQFGKPVRGSIPTIIRSFKSAVTKQINEIRQTPGMPVWQRNYWEHIIRDEHELNRIRQYIRNNPMNWKNNDNFDK